MPLLLLDQNKRVLYEEREIERKTYREIANFGQIFSVYLLMAVLNFNLISILDWS